MELIQQLVNGISLGSIYALIALGYTMVYGIVELINLRPWRRIHGRFICGLLRHYRNGLILHTGFIDFNGHSTIFGVLIERIAYKPFVMQHGLRP